VTTTTGGWAAPTGGSGASRLAAAVGLGLLVVLGAAATLALWWHDPTTRRVHNLGDVLTGVGRASGLLAGYLLILQVALMSRIPWLERRVGADWLTAAHRWMGSYLFGLVLAHVVTIVTGYAATTHEATVHELHAMVFGYPDVWLATIAAGLFAVVVTLSLPPLRRRLSYETWHYVHLLGYLAIGLAFAHQLANGAQFILDRTARTAWIALHVGVGVLLFRYRLAEPVRLWLRHRFRVVDVIEEPDGSTSVYVGGRGLASLDVRPGQFFRWRFLTRNGWWEAHPFSVSQAPNGRWLRMTAKPVGEGSHALRGLTEGVPVVLEGPYGALTSGLRRHRHLLLVAGGSGIAPLYALAQEASVRHDRVTLVHRVRDPETALFRSEVAQLAGAGRIRAFYLTGRRGAPGRPDPFTPQVFRQLQIEPRRCDVYLCGPAGMVEAVRDTLQRSGVPNRHIHSERFSW